MDAARNARWSMVIKIGTQGANVNATVIVIMRNGSQPLDLRFILCRHVVTRLNVQIDVLVFGRKGRLTSCYRNVWRHAPLRTHVSVAFKLLRRQVAAGS